MMRKLTRRHVLASGLCAPVIWAAGPAGARPSAVLDDAARFGQLRAIAVWSGGVELAARGYGKWNVEQATNVKSASKSVISALVGIAISRGTFSGVDERLSEILPEDFPVQRDPRLNELTISHLLSMQSGLTPQSGAAYAAWVTSDNWVRKALAAPMLERPGGRMLYSTASTHLLSAALAKRSGRTTLDLARDWLGQIPGFRIEAWQRDPQGIYIGGNEMAMSTRSLLAFGASYAAEGYAGGRSVIPLSWIRESWQRRTVSAFTKSGYGYGWFLAEMAGRQVNYGWGFGGQMIYVAPATADRSPVAIAMTSDPALPSGANGYRAQLHQIATEILTSI